MSYTVIHCLRRDYRVHASGNFHVPEQLQIKNFKTQNEVAVYDRLLTLTAAPGRG
jgi:hypothetical protein